jgi:hypothetical protein
MTSYRMLKDSDINPVAKKGITVYRLIRPDYGLASQDERAFGYPVWSMTLNPNGDYPSFTVPCHELELIKGTETPNNLNRLPHAPRYKIPKCDMCDDTGFKDHAGFAIDKCDHKKPETKTQKTCPGCSLPVGHYDGSFDSKTVAIFDDALFHKDCFVVWAALTIKHLRGEV